MEHMFGLNPRQTTFCHEYLLDFNGKQAAIRAGYAPFAAEVTASRLLRNAKVGAYIEYLRREQSARLEIDADRVVLEAARLAFSDIRDTMTWTDRGMVLKDSEELTDDAARAIMSYKEKRRVIAGRNGADDILDIEREVKFHPKLPAIELLAKHLGLLTRDGDRNQEPRSIFLAYMRELDVHTPGEFRDRLIASALRVLPGEEESGEDV
jgi:phage terminase small subunit